MDAPLVAVTGFGPFLDVARNPSGEVALALAELPPSELGGARVLAGVLPVTFGGAPAALDALLAGLPARPVAILALGVQRDATFRLEQRARPLLGSAKPDNAGVHGGELAWLAGGERRTTLALAPLVLLLQRSGAEHAVVSADAGGFVCERVYHHVLGRAAELGVPGLFLHVPPASAVPVERQVTVVAALVARLALLTGAGSEL